VSPNYSDRPLPLKHAGADRVDEVTTMSTRGQHFMLNRIAATPN